MEIKYIILTIIIAVIVSELLGFFIFLYYTKKKNESSVKVASITDTTERLKLYSNFDFDKIDSRINRYIDDAGVNYKVNNFGFKLPDELYLNEEEIQKMIKRMIKDVRKRITPAVLSLLKLSYNIESEDDLIEFLYEKIKIYVLNYSLEVNQVIEE